MSLTTLQRLTGYAQEANLRHVTSERDHKGYGTGKGVQMDAFIAFISLMTVVAAVAVGAVLGGSDSRPSIGDDHAR